MVTTTKVVLSLAIAGATCVSASRAFGGLLPGNVWPNPTLETQAVLDPLDPVDRPDGWHRGGNDYQTPTPAITFWNPLAADSVSGTHSLYDQDHTTSGYGEWFSDFNAVPAGSGGSGTAFNFRFNWKFNIQNEVHRVSVRWGDLLGNDLGGGPDFLARDTDAPLLNFVEVNSVLTPPVAAYTFRLTISSGGSSAAFGDLWVDDISAAAAVPEPTSVAAGAVIGFGLLRRRRS